MRKVICLFIFLLLFCSEGKAVESQQNSGFLDLSNAVIVDNEVDGVVSTVLIDEIKKKTGLELKVSEENKDNVSSIILDRKELNLPPESYKIESDSETNSVKISAADKRGLLYGAGAFLRKMDWEKGYIKFPKDYFSFLTFHSGMIMICINSILR
jgi:hypothetical protein